MRVTTLLVLSVLLVTLVPAQKKQYVIDTSTPEGLLLQQAGQESDDAKKLEMYEQFLAKFPKHEGAVYAWTQAQPLMLKAKMFDKVIAGGEVVLAADDNNAPAAYNALQACEQKGDAQCIITWANRTVDAARKVVSSQKPEGDSEAEAWAREVDYAKQVITRCEYSFYAASLQSADPKNTVAYYEALEKINPDSQYIAETGGRYLIALLQLKEVAKAQEFAVRAADRGKASDDTLLFAADASLSSGKNYDKAIAFADKIIATMPGEQAPAGMQPAAWETKKKNSMGRAHWIAGAAQGAKSNWLESEKSMHAALPLIEGNPAAKDLLPGAYFYLGLANYNLSKAGAKRDAARAAAAKKYFTDCAAIASPFKAQAEKNLQAMAAGK